ncbi:MAG: glycine--tRNA ligase subunit beta [Alphaproteobacteria bacterium]
MTNTAELLIELRSEDIPARMQKQGAADFCRLMQDGLNKAGLSHGKAFATSTPRRLVCVIEGLETEKPAVTEERRGPRVGAPEQALMGFCRGNGLSGPDELVKRDTGKGEFWFAEINIPGSNTMDALPGIIDAAIRAVPWPKSMRWRNTDFRWVRPLKGILAVFGGNTVDGSFDAGGDNLFPYTNSTLGHRFLAPGEVTVTSWEDYKTKLEAAKVIVDRDARRVEILDRARTLASSEGLKLNEDKALADEVAGLVEWPVPLIGEIDQAFMVLPEEVLVTSMRVHQRYFVTRGSDGKLANRFLPVSNMINDDGGKAVVHGNERVLKARLADAVFFWDTDKKTRLEDRLGKLEAITFHQKLGTVRERVDRLVALSGWLADKVDGADRQSCERAALLCKADLNTNMVFEFTELQGIMGGHYAREQGESETVANAISTHYQPQGPADDCPTAAESVVVALAEKVDTLTGFFSIDQKPTGSRDPFALRRAALGVIRLVVENDLRLSLRDLFMQAHSYYTTQLPTSAEEVADDILSFFADRLKVVLKDRGVRHDLIDAVFALGGEDDLKRLLARVDALGTFLSGDEGANLLAAYRRATNIVTKEAKKDGAAADAAAIAPDAFALDEERALHSALTTATQSATDHLSREDFTAAMQALSQLRQPVDDFFDKVTVNADDADLRRNRLALLAGIQKTLTNVADFSRIEG